MTKIILFLFVLSILRIATTADTVTPGTAIRDGDTLVSKNQTFELGFFSPGISKNRYVGIWYKRVSTGTVVWVANRETPIFDRSGVIHFTDLGTLVLLNSTKEIVWSSNTTKTVNSPIAQVLDSGNFIVRDENDINPANYLWQSFDYPCDTQLPGMKIGRNFVTGQEWTASSWKSLDDPAKGEYSGGVDLHGFPQLVYKRGNTIQLRVGSWNGVHFTSVGRQNESPIYKIQAVWNEKEASYAVELRSKLIYRIVINASGLVTAMVWIDRHWIALLKSGEDRCDIFALCGNNSKCNTLVSPYCSCLDGFTPKFARAWSFNEWSGGCVRQMPLSCSRGDGFVKHDRMKLPDTSSSWFNTSMSLEQCKKLCLENCSCTAYSSTDIRNGGTGCLHWFDDLVDIREIPELGQEFFIRMDASFIDNNRSYGQSARRKKIIIISGIVISFIVILLIGLILFMRMRFRDNNRSGNEDLDLPMISLADIVNATNNFSSTNKLGQGGFGPVYKGILTDGKEIAVKRLSMNSGQGVDEFKNEVLLIAKLQHRNLVRLLGCCIEGNETMLIYEFMPNKSLDHFIFDETKSELLDWPKRNNIISGIARGLVYLHQDSRLRIIHRDLKAGNVLLDIDMNPKISDFGLARAFGGDQTVSKTRRVVGTYGYMSPEYAIDGNFSTKSDIFSFGVLLLEIVSGKKNRGFSHPDHDHNLLGHAWILWNERRPEELITYSVSKTIVLSEILRCIHVGLLCVQHKPEDRPSMSSVVVMLDSETPLPEPKEPGFFTQRRIIDYEGESSSSKQKSHSLQTITLSEIEPR